MPAAIGHSPALSTATLPSTGGSVLNSIVEQVFDIPLFSDRRGSVVGRHLSTAKSGSGKLADAGILKLLVGVSPKTYFAPELFSVAYEDIADDTHDSADVS